MLLKLCGSMEMAPRLAPLLKDGDADIRQAAALAISALASKYGQPATPEVLAALVEPMLAALNDNDRAIRETAVQVLGLAGDRRAVEPLLRVLSITTSEYRCWACMDALGRLGDPRAIDAIRPYLTHETKELRRHAAYSLSLLRDDRVVEPLKSLLRDPEIQVRETAVAALAATTRPRALDAVRSEALSAQEASMREAALKALRPFPGPETDATLVRALKDPDVNVRRTAGWILLDVAQPESVPALIDALTDEDLPVRQRAAEALGKLGDRRAVDPLIRVLKHALPEAATALGQLGDGRAIDALRELALTPPQPREDDRYMPAAVTALGKIGDPRALVALLHLLQSPQDTTVNAAVRVLLELRDPRTLPDAEQPSARDRTTTSPTRRAALQRGIRNHDDPERILRSGVPPGRVSDQASDVTRFFITSPFTA